MSYDLLAVTYIASSDIRKTGMYQPQSSMEKLPSTFARKHETSSEAAVSALARCTRHSIEYYDRAEFSNCLKSKRIEGMRCEKGEEMHDG
jgi:hypothetical protein